MYQTAEEFLGEAFGGAVPEPRAFWLRGPARKAIRRILGHPYRGLRIRYWSRDGRSAWILEEIGKYKPITTGYVVDGGGIDRVKVLAYRESHGWEVRHKFFTDRFRGVSLVGENALSRSIDGISGATLSVNALSRLARLALYLHQQVHDPAGKSK